MDDSLKDASLDLIASKLNALRETRLPTKTRLIMVLILLPVSALSQLNHSSAAKLELAAAKRVAILFKQFEGLLQPTSIERLWTTACARNCADAGPLVRESNIKAGAEKHNALDTVAAQIHSEVYAYIGRAVQPKHVDLIDVEHSLKRILGEATDELPSVFMIDSDGAPCLIVVYTLLKGPLMGRRATSVVVRAYRITQSAFRLKAVTGDDMDGYVSISVVKLHSPVSQELWLLLSGQYTGANGPNIRMRLYAYGKSKFRTMWAPENAWGAFKIRLTDHGFTIDGDYYRETNRRHNAYVVSDDGVYRDFPHRLNSLSPGKAQGVKIPK